VKVSDYVAKFLEAQGVEVVFDVIGGMITHMIDSLHVQGTIRIVDVHHEQAAAFAAEAAARISGIPGIAMATSGPGATNLLTGIGSCYFDSTPAVFITGQVNRNEQKGDRPIRQLGFQETDIVSMVLPITKAAWTINDPEQIPEMLARAFELALSGRPGPVLLDIPLDVQRMDIAMSPPHRLTIPNDLPPLDRSAISGLLDAVAKAQRPLILVGGGVRSGRATDVLRQFVRAIQVPVVNSLMAVDVIPADDPLRIGMIGSYGNRWANRAIGTADLLIVLGSRLDIRQTGAQTEAFKGDRAIYHVDCDAGEINNRVLDCVPIQTQLVDFLNAALDQLKGRTMPAHEAWLTHIMAERAEWPDTEEIQGIPGINPNAFMHALSRVSGAAAGFIVDVGQHQMWAAQSLDLHSEQRFLTSGGMGAMGFALPAALGAAVAQPGHPFVMIAGDGSFQLNLQELQTVVRNQLPLKLVIINNQTHGMVRQFQQTYFEERYQSTYWGYSAPNFVQVAQAYGIAGATVSETEQLDDALALMWQDPNAPFLLQVMIDTFANAYPKMAFGLPITEMEPLAKPLDMEGT